MYQDRSRNLQSWPARVGCQRLGVTATMYRSCRLSELARLPQAPAGEVTISSNAWRRYTVTAAHCSRSRLAAKGPVLHRQGPASSRSPSRLESRILEPLLAAPQITETPSRVRSLHGRVVVAGWTC
jgi:hypothetical protein